MDPLHDPDDDALLHPRQARTLATTIEAARLSSGAVREGRVGQVGAANVVVNPGSPLTAANHACGLWGTLAEVASTLLRLEDTFAEAGRSEAVVYASPSTVAEIEGIADDAGWRAVEENVCMMLRSEAAGAVGESPVRTARQDDLAGIAELMGDETGLSETGESRLARNLGQRIDDPRCLLGVVDDTGVDRVAGIVSGFVEHGVGIVDHVAVRTGRRGRGTGRALLASAVDEARRRGARMVTGYAAAGGSDERFAEACGFESVYEVTTYARRIDDVTPW